MKYNIQTGVKTSRFKVKTIAAAIVSGLFVASALPIMANAASPIVVTPGNTQGWSGIAPLADTRPGGTVGHVSDATTPAGVGALRLTTDSTNAAKAQYMHAADVGTLLSSVTELGYSTKQNSASFSGGDVSFQLPVFLGGTTGFTTLVYEPYENGTVTPGIWQAWNVDAGQFWSSRTTSCSGGGVTAGAGGAPFYTLSQLVAMCPEAVVLGYGVNVGTFNPSYDVETDLFNYNGVVYDFEPTVSLASKDACKNDGWKTSNTPVFKNQGDCVSFFASKGKNPANG